MWTDPSHRHEDHDDLWSLSYFGFRRLAGSFAHDSASHHFPAYFHDSVVEAVRRSRALARERGVTFVATLAQSSNSDAAVEVLGDPVQLEAMVESVVRKALRCSPHGSRVELDVQVRGDSIVLYVRDHGPRGVADSQRAAAQSAEPPPQSRANDGSDLAVAKRVAAHHRGTISIHNREDGGCELGIRLPRWRTEGPPPLRAV